MVRRKNHKPIIALTGATGTMGRASVTEILNRGDFSELRVLVRPSKANFRKVKEWMKLGNVKPVWGDLLDRETIDRLVSGVDTVVHMGGMVSPAADWFPEETYKVNVGAARNIVDAIKASGQAETTALVYIGSVSQYGPRSVPFHWGGPGDPMLPALFDTYALSKIEAERIVSESGLKRWVSLRQSGILSPDLLGKGSDPITFHVPLNGVLEWSTVEDSGRLIAAMCTDNVPEEVWCDFHDIGSGREFRLTNYEFEKLLLKALSCPEPERIFEPQWFAQRNFHGVWYVSSDRLNDLVPFRANITAEKYFKEMADSLPWVFSLTRLVPSFIIKAVMKHIASDERFGTLGWIKTKNKEKLNAYFGSFKLETDWHKAIAPKEKTDSNEVYLLDVGYDRSKPVADMDERDLRNAAARRGGELLSEFCGNTEANKPLTWRCAEGHEFVATATTVCRGGHWCPECGYGITVTRLEKDSLLRDAYMTTHSQAELSVAHTQISNDRQLILNP